MKIFNHQPVILIALLIFAFTNDQLEAQIREMNDIAYLPAVEIENDTLQRLNLVLPKGVVTPPLLIWIGGGAWSYVDRNVEMVLAHKFAEKGIAVASVGHRLSSALWKDPSLNMGYQHPDHIEDLASAFKYLYDHAEEYGYDLNKIFVGGFSSGAHLAALLALDPKYLEKHALSPQNIKGIIPIAGTYDIPQYYDALYNSPRQELAELHVESVFGKTRAQQLDASPTHYLQNLSVPILLISERNSYDYTRIFEDKIMETEFEDIEILHVRELGHSAFWKELSFSENSRYRDLIAGFIQSPS